MITRLYGSTHTNVISPRAEAWIRRPPPAGRPLSDFTAKVRSVVADPAVEVEPTLGFSAGASRLDTPLFAAIERVAARQKSRPSSSRA